MPKDPLFTSDTLRDDIAMAVLPEVYRGSVELGQIDQDSIAQECYEIADAMLKAREL